MSNTFKGKNGKYYQQVPSPKSNYNSSSNAQNKFEGKNDCNLEIVKPRIGQDFEPFEKITGWKTTKRFGFIAFEAFAMKNQKISTGEHVKDGFEKWRINLKTAIGSQLIFGIYNLKKDILSFQMGTTKCAASPKKHYFSFVTPEGLKNKKR